MAEGARGIRHVILTRHAVRVADSPLPSRAWLDSRRALLVDLTAMSLRAQTCTDFLWVLLVDRHLIDEERPLLVKDLGPGLDVRIVATDGPIPPLSGLGALNAAIGIDVPGIRVLTTRLDSDDALAPSFCCMVRHHAGRFDDERSIDLIDGAYVDREVGIPLRRPYRASPFQSLVETSGPAGSLRTVLQQPHHILPDVVPYTPIRTREPMWFVSIHGGNLANQAIGVPAPAALVPSRLRHALGVRDSTRAGRLGYGIRIARRYAARIVDRGDRAGVDTLLGHARAKLLGR